MLFLIHFEVTVPADTPAELKEQLRQGEHARAFELIQARVCQCRRKTFEGTLPKSLARRRNAIEVTRRKQT